MARYARGVLNLGRDDVLLASFPKSGSTWVRFVLCHLVSLRYWDGRALDFATLDATMPELGVDSLAERWAWGKLLPRVVKTHTAAWPVLRRVPAVLLVRNPMDVVVSFHHHDQAQGGLRLGDAPLSTFVRHPRHGVPGWVRHTRSWLDRQVPVVRYETLRSDPKPGFATLLSHLGVKIPEDLLEEALERSSLEEVRRAEMRGGLNPAKGFDPSFRFARKGSMGEGRETLSDEDQVWIRTYLREHGVTLYE
jgi:hypothetical protein